MSELRELYHEIIIDHGRNPRNFKVLPQATQSKEGYNPLCGDKIHLFINEKAGIITRFRFLIVPLRWLLAHVGIANWR